MFSLSKHFHALTSVIQAELELSHKGGKLMWYYLNNLEVIALH